MALCLAVATSAHSPSTRLLTPCTPLRPVVCVVRAFNCLSMLSPRTHVATASRPSPPSPAAAAACAARRARTPSATSRAPASRMTTSVWLSCPHPRRAHRLLPCPRARTSAATAARTRYSPAAGVTVRSAWAAISPLRRHRGDRRATAPLARVPSAAPGPCLVRRPTLPSAPCRGWRQRPSCPP